MAEKKETCVYCWKLISKEDREEAIETNLGSFHYKCWLTYCREQKYRQGVICRVKTHHKYKNKRKKK